MALTLTGDSWALRCFSRGHCVFFFFFPQHYSSHFRPCLEQLCLSVDWRKTQCLALCWQLPAKVLSFKCRRKFLHIWAVCKGMKRGQMRDLLIIISSASAGRRRYFRSAFSIPHFFFLPVIQQSTSTSSPVALRLFRVSVCGCPCARACACTPLDLSGQHWEILRGVVKTRWLYIYLGLFTEQPLKESTQCLLGNAVYFGPGGVCWVVVGSERWPPTWKKQKKNNIHTFLSWELS